MPAIGSRPRPMSLSFEEEKLIRALRIGDFQSAQASFDRMAATRRAEDSALVKQLSEDGGQK